jgi:alpha-L-fucosidase
VDLALEKMGKSGSLGARTLCWSALMLCVFQVASAALSNCTYARVFVFPNKFANAELDPNSILFPTHAADRFTDGKLPVDFLGT